MEASQNSIRQMAQTQGIQVKQNQATGQISFVNANSSLLSTESPQKRGTQQISSESGATGNMTAVEEGDEYPDV